MTEKVFPPLNFTMIEDNLYRSALPSPINYPVRSSNLIIFTHSHSCLL